MNKFNTKEYRKKYTGIYGSWYAMKQRCGNPNNLAYHNYGGRGIIYDKKWEFFAGFKEDMGLDYKKGLTIERIDNNGNYCRENCQWATKKEQCNNMRKNIFIEYKGEKKTLSQWADKIGLKFQTVKMRYYRGMSIKQILKNSLYHPATI